MKCPYCGWGLIANNKCVHCMATVEADKTKETKKSENKKEKKDGN